MNASIIMDVFDEREPIVRNEIQNVLNINTLNQIVSYLVSYGILKRYENGIYYIRSSKKNSHI